MNRGDIYWVNFDPAMGSEITKTRPAIIVSNNISNRHLSRVQVVPLTSNISKVYPSETIILVNSKNGKALADQITTIDKSRIQKFIGILSIQDIQKVDQILRLQLGM